MIHSDLAVGSYNLVAPICDVNVQVEQIIFIKHVRGRLT